MKKRIFSAADILLPDLAPRDSAWTAWSVIACDQFTGQPEYWESARRAVGGRPSALSLVLPEVYLGGDRETELKKAISTAMKELPLTLREHGHTMVYLERTLPDGKLRRGIIGCIDLEEYDFSAGSASGVRATEETVAARVPARVEIRRCAQVELPHVMIFFDDSEHRLLSALTASAAREPLYDFELMLGGGHVRGYAVEGAELAELEDRISKYELSRGSGVVYAVGDGNHSLAGARAYYDELKAELGNAALSHPARYALVEAVNIHDEAIEFEPIYRLLSGCDPEAVLARLPKTGREVEAVFGGERRTVYVPDTHPLTVGCLQGFIDGLLKAEPGISCDYIHGLDTLNSLAAAPSALGFICGGIEKSELFTYVEQNGALPRKTFSMGEAKSKRYYLEARKIK